MLGSCLDNVRRAGPLVHCITNYVTANDVANVLLACGARPVMADDPGEAGEVAALCGGLALNLGTLSRQRLDAMLAAGRRANELGRPVLLDPVGVGSSALRTRSALRLLGEVRFAVIRGNISEMRVLAAGAGATHGVDADAADAVSEAGLDAAVAFAKGAAARLGAVVAVTGAVDLVADAGRCCLIRNGRPEMRLVTGTGCQLSGLTAAFLAANPGRPLEAAAAAAAAMGLAGEIGWANMQPADGNATYRNRIIDAVYQMDGAALDRGARYEFC